MRLLATLYSHFGEKRELRTFRLLQNPPAWAWKKQCPFFHFIWRLLNTHRFFGSLLSKSVYKMFTKTVESWKPGPNFLEWPHFLDEYVVLIKCYLVGVECQIQDIITICPKKPTLNCFGNPGNVGMFTTKVYRFVNTSTSLQICSTNVYNCLQRIYMSTKPIQVKLLERILNY